MNIVTKANFEKKRRNRYMKVGILYQNDTTANSVRSIEIKRFLDNRGCKTKLIGFNKFSYIKYLAFETAAKVVLAKHNIINEYNLIKKMQKWADIIERKILKNGKFDVIICEDFLYAYTFTRDLDCLKIFDCSTPHVDELMYSGNYTKEHLAELRELEIEIYEKSDYVAFHWETYKNYVMQHIYNGKNVITLNWGCHPQKDKANFSHPPKLIYLGNLSGYWINKELLSHLTKIAPNKIDVYGLPKPDKKCGLNYKCFAKDTDIMNEYQFGLITITNDPLRCEGFSAKHIEYLSYGLPVFVPEWRRHLDLLNGSIQYNESTFLDLIEKYSDEDEWNKMSSIAYQQAKKLDWNITLKNLDRIIQKG